MCKVSGAFPGNWDPAPPGLVKQAIKYKAWSPAGIVVVWIIRHIQSPGLLAILLILITPYSSRL